MGSFRFVHAADIHLDSPLKGLASLKDSAIERILSATRDALSNLVTRTVEEEAAFLIIAGDLYDRDWPDYRTGLYFVSQMGRLREAGIPVFLIYGNHDAQSQITRRLTLPDNVRVFPTSSAQTHRIERLGVALHGQGFPNRAVSENLARKYPEPVSGAVNIGILHTSLQGEAGHDPYAPCSIDDLANKGYDYWALGHVHQPSVRLEAPYVVYSGNTQGRHINESGPRGACLVTVKDGKVSDVARIATDVVRWHLAEVPAAGCVTLEELYGRIRKTIEDAVDRVSDGRLLALRIEISGRTDIHAQLLASREAVTAETQAFAAGIGAERSWVEKVVLKTEPSPASARDPALTDALGDLSEAIRDDAVESELHADLGKLVSRLPPELRTQPEDPFLRAAVDGDYEGLTKLAGEYAMARLLGDEG